MVEESSAGASVAVVVSLYNPPNDLPARAARWLTEVGPVVAVDDGSRKADSHSVLQALDAAGVQVLRNGTNQGIAHSLNRGISFARSHFSPGWFLTMDQDSDMPRGYMESAFAEYGELRTTGRIGMICPGKLNGVQMELLSKYSTIEECFDPICSGSLVKDEMLRDIGGFREDFFIDVVDSEFNARARSRGWVLMMAHDCNLIHSLGTARPMRVLGWHVRLPSRKLYVHYHAPFRLYYMSRNTLVLCSQYFRNQPTWTARRLFIQVEMDCVRLAFGPDRRKHLRALLRGGWDAVRHRSGPIDPDLARRIHVNHSS